MLYVVGAVPAAAVKFTPVALVALRFVLWFAGLKWNAVLAGVTV
jgi:hypothetical protein